VIVEESWRARITNHEDSSISDSIRKALLDRGFLAPSERSLDDLRVRTDNVWQAVHDSDWPSMRQELPSLLQDVCELIRHSDLDLDSCRLISDIYQAASSVLLDAGELDLAWICADRAITFPERAEDGLGVASGFFRLGHVALRCGRHEDAILISQSGTKSIDELPGMTDVETASLRGALSLVRAIAHARMGDADSAKEDLSDARQYAELVPEGTNIAHTEFDGTNLKLHEVGVYVELGLAGKAMSIADSLTDIDLSVERRARFLIDVFRAQYMLRDYRGMDKSLPEAYSMSPEEVRRNRYVREILNRIKDVQSDLPEALSATVAKLM
jgi:tetratricopeptide (TPR) repeat protein